MAAIYLPGKDACLHLRSTKSQRMSIVAYLIGGIIAVGAVFGALNALYSARSADAWRGSCSMGMPSAPTAGD